MKRLTDAQEYGHRMRAQGRTYRGGYTREELRTEEKTKKSAVSIWKDVPIMKGRVDFWNPSHRWKAALRLGSGHSGGVFWGPGFWSSEASAKAYVKFIKAKYSSPGEKKKLRGYTKGDRWSTTVKMVKESPY